MKLKTRIMLLTVGGLIAILVIFSLFIYVFFIRATTDAEIRLLWNRAQTVLRMPEVRLPEEWEKPGLLREFLAERMMIRIIDPAGNVRSAVSDDAGLMKLRPVYRTSYNTRIVAAGAIRRLYIQVPVLELPEKRQVGTLEIAKSFSLTRGYLRILLVTLASGTLIAIFFAIGAAILYVRWIYKPVGLLAGKMEEIEESGAFGRLEGKFASGEDEFGRLGSTFNRMMSRLEDNYKRQRHFVEDASHELRTPLTVIGSYAGMLRRWGGDDRKLREEAVTAIEQESERLLHLVKSLLQSADGGEGAPKADFAPVDLLELAVQTAHELFLSFERTITVHPLPGHTEPPPFSSAVPAKDCEAGDFRLEGDREKLKQLLIILLDNALKYSSQPVEVLLREERGPDRIILSVHDRGVGIAPEHIGHLFDRFYRVDQARTRQTGGSGLGLSIARRIVTEHRGEIAVKSEPGQGTVVTVRLPRQQKDSAEKDF